MASGAAFTILLGFAAAFWCLEPLESASKIQASATASPVARVAAGALLPSMLATFCLNLLLLAAHVRALDHRASAAGGPLQARLAKAVLAATATALVAGAVLLLVAGGDLGGADDVGWIGTQ